jgi:orotate phosphoribosyltransferase
VSDVARDRARLLELLRDRSFARKKVILASGRESDFFIDCKQAVLTAEGHVLVGALLFDALLGLPKHEAVAGVELGGCPLASAVAYASFQHYEAYSAAAARVSVLGPDAPASRLGGLGALDAIYVRKDAKDHGSKRLLEGDSRLARGARVAIVEDVITTGGSTLKAAAKLRDAGYAVVGVVAVVDRLEGGREAIEAEKLPVVALYTRRDFIPD